MTEAENSSLAQTLQRANVELTIAFDATVEAFARAMELREGEPLGHTRQVTEVTVNLAKAMGIGILFDIRPSYRAFSFSSSFNRHTCSVRIPTFSFRQQ